MLKKADLESHGYTKELTTKLVSDSGSDKPSDYQKAYFYYKIVDCSRLQEIIQELETLGKRPIFIQNFWSSIITLEKYKSECLIDNHIND